MYVEEIFERSLSDGIIFCISHDALVVTGQSGGDKRWLVDDSASHLELISHTRKHWFVCYKLFWNLCFIYNLFSRGLKGVNWDSRLRLFWKINFRFSIPEKRLSDSGVEKPIKIILSFWITITKNSKLGSRSLHVAIAIIGILKFRFWILYPPFRP